MDSRINKYIKTEVVSEDIPKYILVESLELQAIIAALNKTMDEIERKKNISANILMDFKDLQKRVEKIVKKPIGPVAREAKILQKMLDNLLKS